MYTIDNFSLNPDKVLAQANIQALKDKATNTYMIPNNQEYRLDLISNSIYGRVEFKWILMYVNNIFSISQLKTNTILKYPKFSDISEVLLRTMERS